MAVLMFWIENRFTVEGNDDQSGEKSPIGLLCRGWGRLFKFCKKAGLFWGQRREGVVVRRVGRGRGRDGECEGDGRYLLWTSFSYQNEN